VRHAEHNARLDRGQQLRPGLRIALIGADEGPGEDVVDDHPVRAVVRDVARA
jgi:hypothetical protein